MATLFPVLAVPQALMNAAADKKEIVMVTDDVLAIKEKFKNREWQLASVWFCASRFAEETTLPEPQQLAGLPDLVRLNF